MGPLYQKKVRMKSIIFFLFALLIVYSTIDAKRIKGRTRTAWLKVKDKRWAISKTPSKCCNKKGLITAKTFYQSAAGQCDMLCPLLKTLKGCEFMCHFHLCYMAYGGSQDQCNVQCPTTTEGPDTTGEGPEIEGIFDAIG